MNKNVRALISAVLTASSVAMLGAAVPSSATDMLAEQVVNTNKKELGSVDKDHYQDGLKAWTPSDSVAVTYFSSDTVHFSPNGKYFFFVGFHGDLACDCNHDQLVVYSTDAVRRALQSPNHKTIPKPERVLHRKSPSGYASTIDRAQWESNNRTITFEGASDDGIGQLFEFDTVSGELRQLTHLTNEVISIARAHDTIISDVVSSDEPPMLRYPMQVITQSALHRAFLPGEPIANMITLVSYEGGPPWKVEGTVSKSYKPWFSTDGRRAIALRQPKRFSDAWSSYDQIAPNPDAFRSSPETTLTQFVLIDAARERSHAVLDAPLGDVTKVGAEFARHGVAFDALWAEDGRHVVLVNTALPMGGSDAERTRMSYIVSYDADSGDLSVLEPLISIPPSGAPPRHVDQVGWLEPGRQLLITHKAAERRVSGTVYSLKGNRWIGRTVSASVAHPQPTTAQPHLTSFSVAVKQDMNSPPAVVATEGARTITLTRSDSALENLWWARTEPIQWREPDGKQITGGLLLPREASHKPLPLVIQTYTYEPERFRPDGPTQHAYAAQALVARGMAVLNIDLPSASGLKEVTDFTARVQAATSVLKASGVIDDRRVGLIGFSRAGFNIYYAITHPGDPPPAAAVIDDSFTGTYWEYLSVAATGGSPRPYESPYGGSFWENRQQWLQHEPSFNVDRVVTPALFTLHGKSLINFALPTLGIFSLNKRPVEFLSFPRGRHVLSTPWERRASQEASIDWMSFWLQDYEDPAPEKVEQYSRWRQMRALRRNALLGTQAASQAYAACIYPAPLDSLLDGATATREQMLAGKTKLVEFDGALGKYIHCLNVEADDALAKSEHLTDEKQKAAHREEILKMRDQMRSAAKEEARAAVARFNEQVHVYDAKQNEKK